MIARARVVAELDRRGRTVLRELASTAPIALRATPDAVYLVGAAAAPLGGDDLALEIEVGPGASLCLRAVAATIALPDRAERPSVTEIRAHVGAGAALRFEPQPLVAAHRCDHRQIAHLELDPTADVLWREELVHGRAHETGGIVAAALRVDLGDAPLLRHELVLGPAGWDGPAVLDGARCVGSLLATGPNAVRLPPGPLGPDAHAFALEVRARLVVTLAADRSTIAGVLDDATGKIVGSARAAVPAAS